MNTTCTHVSAATRPAGCTRGRAGRLAEATIIHCAAVASPLLCIHPITLAAFYVSLVQVPIHESVWIFLARASRVSGQLGRFGQLWGKWRKCLAMLRRDKPHGAAAWCTWQLLLQPAPINVLLTDDWQRCGAIDAMTPGLF